ncbi:MAG: hypothetical protein V1926_01295 [Candidatus Peregrinibacteria bacterium]
MDNVERYADKLGNSVTIRTTDDGVTVSARVRTIPPYTGKASAAAARSYADAHGLALQK